MRALISSHSDGTWFSVTYWGSTVWLTFCDTKGTRSRGTVYNWILIHAREVASKFWSWSFKWTPSHVTIGQRLEDTRKPYLQTVQKDNDINDYLCPHPTWLCCQISTPSLTGTAVTLTCPSARIAQFPNIFQAHSQAQVILVWKDVIKSIQRTCTATENIWKRCFWATKIFRDQSQLLGHG